MRYLTAVMLTMLLCACSEGGKGPISSIVDAVKSEELKFGGPNGLTITEMREQPFYQQCRIRYLRAVYMGLAKASPQQIHDLCGCKYSAFVVTSATESLADAFSAANSPYQEQACLEGKYDIEDSSLFAKELLRFKEIPIAAQWEQIDPNGVLRKELEIDSAQPVIEDKSVEANSASKVKLPTPVGKFASIVAKDAAQAKNIDFLLSPTSLEGTHAQVATLSESIRKGEVDKVIVYGEVENNCNAVDIDFIGYMSFECEIGGNSLIVTTDSDEVAAQIDGGLYGQKFFMVGVMSLIEGHVHMHVN